VKHQKNHCLITMIVAMRMIQSPKVVEVDSESEGDTIVTLVSEPIIACFSNRQCNTRSEDDDEWVINDNVSFDYPASFELFESVTDSSLQLLNTSSTSVKYIEGSILVVPPSKKGQH